VNDDHGHLAGDDLLKQFAKKLKSACRSTDLIGRWGGDEFIILLYCGVWQAKAQCERLREWISGNYTVHVDSRTERLKVNASIGLAERLPTDKMHELLGRADAAMYQHKASSRLSRVAVEQPAS
jgi:diguanylate cyclase (GGDEF)-like protein